MSETLRILSTITSNPRRLEELERGVSAVSERTGHPVSLSCARDEEEILEEIGGAHVLLTYRLSPRKFRSAECLEWVHFGAAGVDHSLFGELLDSDVVLSTSKGIHADVMGEYAVMAVIALACGLPQLVDAQRHRTWAGREIRPLHHAVEGKRLLVLGFGNTGEPAARKAAALGMRVTAVKRTPPRDPVPRWLEGLFPIDRLEGLLPAADYLLLALPLTPETEGLMDRERLRTLPRGAGVVNMARGGLLDEGALLDALDSDHLRGAVLDCFETEPLPEGSRFWKHPKVLVTPHMSGNFDDYTRRVIERFLEDLERYLKDEPLPHPIDREAGY
ncbi:MAG: D-2-hydroxyacid dehydrogenase [bacterium]